MNKTKVDDLLIEMITPKVHEIEKKFSDGEGLSQDDINTLLLKSQYNHINHLDDKLDEVTADVSSLKGEFSGLKDDFLDLKNEVTNLKNDFTDFKNEFADFKNEFAGIKADVSLIKGEFALLKKDIEVTIQTALNKNMMMIITAMGVFVILSKIVDKF